MNALSITLGSLATLIAISGLGCWIRDAENGEEDWAILAILLILASSGLLNIFGGLR